MRNHQNIMCFRQCSNLLAGSDTTHSAHIGANILAGMASHQHFTLAQVNGSFARSNRHTDFACNFGHSIYIVRRNGHASLTQEAGTRALVLHFSAAVFKPLVKKGIIYQFPSCRSGSENRMDECYRLIRFYVSQIFRTVQENSPYAQLAAKAQLELLAICLCTNFEHTTFNVLPEDVERRAIARRLLGYVEEHYASKLTLEDLADYAQYNRTYISTLFKQMVGINFHEYLTRVRFQHALNDLAGTHDNLTDIALRNGFADLKTFNARFRATLQQTPAEYRANLPLDRVVEGMQRRFLAPEDGILQQKLAEYGQIGKF